MKVNDAVSGAILILFGVGVALYAQTFRGMPGQAYGPGLLPTMIGVFMAVGGLWLIVTGWGRRRQEPWFEGAPWLRSPDKIANVALVLGALVFYIVASEPLGFLLTSFAILSVMMIWLRGVRSVLSSVAMAAIATLVIQQFFGQLLRVPLPRGLLPPPALF